MGEENNPNSIKTNDDELKIDKSSLKIKFKLPIKPDPDQEPDEIEEGEIRPEPEPKPEPEQPQQQEEHQPPPAGAVVCPHCNRDFINGKALGGHMRVHADKLKSNHPSPNPNPSPKGGLGPITCDICHKEFKSQKSLFGHMRSHPERNWRGMQPPTEGPNPAPKSDRCSGPKAGQVVGMGSAPDLRWGMKGIRGHKGVWVGSGSSSPASESMAEHEAAWTLLALSAGVSCFDPSERSSSAYFDEDELYFLQDSEVLERKPEDPEKDPKGKGKGKKRVRVQVQVQVRVREGSDDPIEEKKGRFECGACNKTFSTYQALGGHMSSHSHKEKISSKGQIVDGSGSGSGFGSGLTSDVKMGTDMGRGDHKDKGKVCKICHKMFPTGQALGGHQRCHYVPESVEPDPNSSGLPKSIEPDPSTPGLPESVEPDPSSPSPSGSQTEGQVVERVGFDLNVAAVEEESDGGDGGGTAAVESEFDPPPAL